MSFHRITRWRPKVVLGTRARPCAADPSIRGVAGLLLSEMALYNQPNDSSTRSLITGLKLSSPSTLMLAGSRQPAQGTRLLRSNGNLSLRSVGVRKGGSVMQATAGEALPPRV